MVFRGTIIALRDSESAADLSGLFRFRDTKKIAVFHVNRIWKGDIGQTFEMPATEETSMCIGFVTSYLIVGNDLLVYASRYGSEYYTSICGFHKRGKDAKDLRELGPGQDPRKVKEQKSK